jgi:hypothetical protein
MLKGGMRWKGCISFYGKYLPYHLYVSKYLFYHPLFYVYPTYNSYYSQTLVCRLPEHRTVPRDLYLAGAT